MAQPPPLLPIVAFDESGNTGENLLDQEQPIYCLASVHVDESDAEALAADILLKGQTELKFGSLRGSRRGRTAILAALTSGLLEPGSARVTPVHKRFMVIAKLFDDLIEPEFYERGIDLYDGGGHLALANLLYRRGPQACGVDRWEPLLASYVAMERDPSDQCIDAFLRTLNTCRIAAGALDVRRLLDVIDVAHVRWAVRLGRDEGTAVPTLDPALPSLVENCNWWDERVGRFVLEHDEAPVMRRLRAEIDRLRAPGAAASVGRYWADRMRLPLGVDSMRVVRSDASRRVQLADLVAGACVAWLRGTIGLGRDFVFAGELSKTPLPGLVENEIWFEPLNPLRRFE
jgi:hypothetical protein